MALPREREWLYLHQPSDCCCLDIAGDDVDKKKPDPKIYNVAAQKLGLDPSECLVIEDSTIGLQAALGAGMRCIITYTPSTKQQVSLAGLQSQTPIENMLVDARRSINYCSPHTIQAMKEGGEGLEENDTFIKITFGSG